MFRVAKYVAVAIFTILAGGVLLLGNGWFSYMQTTAVEVQESVQSNVPIEFQLRRAKVMIDGILPDVQAQVRLIAQEEVEIAALQKNIEQSRSRLAGEETALAELRNQMRTQLVSFQDSDRQVNRPQKAEQLSRRFDRYKAGEIALASKEKLLEKRQQSLGTALSALDSMRHRKAELELQVESLAAQSRIVQASRSESGIRINGDELSEADELIGQIETRLAVAQRVLEHEQDWLEIEPVARHIDEDKVLAEFDEYFGTDGEMMVTTKVD